MEKTNVLFISVIPLTGKHGVGLFTKVSREDYEAALAYNKHWNRDRYGYAYCTKNINGKRTHVYLHQFITGEKYVDHVNGDKLDNRRSNLFAGGAGENNRNVNRKTESSSSQFPGVYWQKRDKKWCAQIRINKKYTYLGYFTDELDAAVTYYHRAKAQHPHMQHPAWREPEFLARVSI